MSMSPTLTYEKLFLLSCWFVSEIFFGMTFAASCSAQDAPKVGQRERKRIQDFEATDILSRELARIESPERISREYFEKSYREKRAAGAVKDIFFDEFLQIAIESPDDFGGWEITGNQAERFHEKFVAYQQFRQDYLDRIRHVEDENVIQTETNQLAKQRAAFSQSLVRSLLPAQAVALVPTSTDSYGLISHVVNGHMLGKWLKLTPSQLEKIRGESTTLCKEIENWLEKYQQKSIDSFFKNLTKEQRNKFFNLFLREKLEPIYTGFSFDRIYTDHSIDVHSSIYDKSFSASKVILGADHGRPELLQKKESSQKLHLFNPTPKLVVTAQNNSDDPDAIQERRRSTAFYQFYVFEYALISLELYRTENPKAFDPNLEKEMKQGLKRQQAHYKSRMALIQWQEGSEQWCSELAKLDSEYREILEETKILFSSGRSLDLLPIAEDMGLNFIRLTRWQRFRDWLGITDQQLERMAEESRELVSDMEANLVDLRQKSADILFSNLSPAQRAQFFEIFDQDKVAFFWGGLSYSTLYAHHQNVKGEHWFLWEGDSSPQKDQPHPLLKPTKLKFPK
jgi:ABC-type transporter MlaC component